MGFGGGAPSLNTNAGSAYSNTLANLGTQFGNMGQTAAGQYASTQPQAIDAAKAYSNFLTQGPTGQFNAQQTANAEKGANEGATAATAQLDQNLASRGISPASSIGVGGQAAIEEGLAANNATVQANNAWRNTEQRGQDLATNANLWSGLASNGFGDATTAYGQEAGINSGLLSNANELAIDKYNQQVAANNAQDALWGSVAGAAGTAFTGKA